MSKHSALDRDDTIPAWALIQLIEAESPSTRPATQASGRSDWPTLWADSVAAPEPPEPDDAESVAAQESS
jgi:hypothetical protein